MERNRKNQILDEATRLFSRYGYDKVTIKQLADACGITEPALYRYFPSKNSLYEAVLDSIHTFLEYEQLFERLKENKHPKTLLHDLSQHIFGFLMKHKELYRLLLYCTLREHPKARSVYQSIRVPLVNFLKEKLDGFYREGKTRKINSELTARCFVGMVFDCALNAILWKGFQGKSYSPEEIVKKHASIFINGNTS